MNTVNEPSFSFVEGLQDPAFPVVQGFRDHVLTQNGLAVMNPDMVP
jgi:hypothetical protein